jgi:methionine-rich copper-binding protein CopC
MNRPLTPHRSKMRTALFCALFASAIGLSVGSASAHTALASSSPENGSTITAWPTSIIMNFTEGLESIKGKAINVVTVSNANGDEVDNGTVSVENNVLTVGLKPNTVSGPVLVNYRVAASDGHVTEAEFAFTFSDTNGKGPDANPSPSTSTTGTSSHNHGAKSHVAIYASSTILIVLTLILGFWIYRRESD